MKINITIKLKNYCKVLLCFGKVSGSLRFNLLEIAFTRV